MLPERFDPAEAEQRLYAAWEKDGCFKPSGDTSAAAYSIVIPPPNVTGSLHMGHALNNTLQDILIRFERLRGKNVLWQPGTDHAGIATQLVVERQLAAAGNEGRRDLGREEFLKRVWAWKEESGGTISRQLRRLGASCDWSRERFTMDEGLSKAVTKVFVDLYNKGLVYRDKRLVNWDPHFETAVSDLEVENTEVDGHMWHFKYPLAGGETYEYIEKDADGNETLRETRDYISIATTRPETMLGDGAVAVHPSDARYAPIIGKLCEIPVGPKHLRRLIPIITDEYPDPEFGSGAVKITGAHDFNDYEVARRGHIPMYRLMDTKGALRNDGAPYADEAGKAQAIVKAGKAPDANTVDAINLVPDAYRGLDRFVARERVIADIDADGLMIKVEKKKIMQPFGDRSNVVIEPMLTDQWYVNAKKLAEPAIAAVRSGQTKFVPENWTKTYYQWMENIQPWCISRQLWWGHRIPAWYGDGGKIYVADSEAAAQKLAGATVKLVQDEDVLDTWFSSALWPFSTQGWPEQTDALKTFYPTSTLVTAFDIIFFWVARMMMMGIEFTGEVPFADVYIHAIVRDENGKKMSKSEGNVIDPVDLIDGIDADTLVAKRTSGLRQPEKAPQIAKETKKKYPKGFEAFGADALRFTLAIMATKGRDINLAVDRVAGYRNFGTKLWNAARFAEMNECGAPGSLDFAAVKNPVNRWILGEFAAAVRETTLAIEDYRFNDASDAVYRFVWNTFCDWYLELIKPILNGTDDGAKAETRSVCGYVIDETLKLLHPFMPFITEELWERRAPGRCAAQGYLMRQTWPSGDLAMDQDARVEINWLIDLISEVRSVRSDLNVPAGAKVPLTLVAPSDEIRRRAEAHGDILMRLARLGRIDMADAAPAKSVGSIAGESTFALEIADLIDISSEKARLDKRIAELDKEISGISGRLSNADFVARAPAEIVEESRARISELGDAKKKLNAARQGLEELG